MIKHPAGFPETAKKMGEIEVAIELLFYGQDERQYNALRAEYMDTYESFMISYRRMLHLVTKVNEATRKKEKHANALHDTGFTSEWEDNTRKEAPEGGKEDKQGRPTKHG